MFLTQVYGTILGGFINYAVMISIVNGNRELLVDSDGNNAWSGATMQSYNTNATSWALAHYLYKIGGKYEMVPIGLGIGFGIVAVHRLVVHVSSARRHRYIGTHVTNMTDKLTYIPVRPQNPWILAV